MARESYNIIGTDMHGDWLICTIDGNREFAESYAERAMHEHQNYKKVTAVKCAA